MAQSSSYKQYSRTTRVLTEESSFAGGMLWTGNNIDETHLKAIVNCDYDDTTGYLKTRDSFVPLEYSPTSEDLQELGVDLLNYRLICTHKISAFDANNDYATLSAGWLYIFTTVTANYEVCEIPLTADNTQCIYYVEGVYYKCNLKLVNNFILRNVMNANILLNYENQLYGIGHGEEENKTHWLTVYRVERHNCAIEDKTQYTFDFTQLSYREFISPRINSVSLLEACVTGFNAAKGEDAFTHCSVDIGASEQPYILGAYCTDSDGNVVVSPRIGQSIQIHVPIACNKSSNTKNYLAFFQLKESGDTASTSLEEPWQLIELGESTNGEFIFNFTFQKKKTTLGFTYYSTKQPTTPVKAYSDDAVDYLMPYEVVANDNLNNLKVKNYDLNSVNGSCIWKNRLCLWGTRDNSNCLFLSEVDNFYYYPIPHNVALFDTNVISCIPYKNTLLVFTADKIYRVSENNDGTFTQTVVQNNIPLERSDAAHLTAIKNMVLFKSGNYFYMIVPKSQSLTDELSIAPIYKNIAGFLNTLDKSTQEVLQLLYPEYLFKTCTVRGNTPTTVYAEQDTIHILYDVNTSISFKDGININTANRSFKVFLNYNTNLRAWTLYVEDTTESSLEVSALTASRAMSFVRVNNNGSFSITTQQPIINNTSNFRILLDTGYRTLATATQKRFREVQLKLYSVSENVSAFGTAFLVDGVWRRNYTKLQEALFENNTVSLVPTLDLNTFVTELSMPVDATGTVSKDPGSDIIELSDWVLDFSHFKREAPVTVRIPVSGKGYSPRFIFMTPNAAGVTINEINWVYRLMHGR